MGEEPTKLFENAADIQRITRQYNALSSNQRTSTEVLEIEARFQQVTQVQFDNLYAALGYPQYQSSTTEILGSTRKITTGTNVTWEEKRQVGEAITVRDQVKFSFSIERPIKPIFEFRPNITRTRSRASVSKPSSRIDLTEVLEENDKNARSKYEVEVELLQGGKLDEYLEVVSDVWTKLMSTNLAVKKIDKDLSAILGEKFSRGILVEARNIKPRDLVWGGIVGPQNACPGVQYGVSIKADGVRRLLLVHPTGVWLVYPPNVYQFLGEVLSDRGLYLINSAKEKHGLEQRPIYLFDAELINNRLLLFDTLIWSSTDVRKKTMLDPAGRLAYTQMAPVFFKINESTSNYSFEAKPIFHIVKPDDVFTLSRKLLEQDPGYPTDGLMFTPLGVEYNPRSSSYNLSDRVLTVLPDVCKWKPPNKITIDFQVRRDRGSISLWARGHKGFEKFTGSSMSPLTTYMISDVLIDGTPMQNMEIVEFEFVENKMRPTRRRPDKLYPNFIDIANDNWRDIHDPLSQDWISGKTLDSAIFYHKKIKRELIRSIPRGSTVLDIGSGRFGDGRMWKELNLAVYAVEPNHEHIERFKSRAKLIEFTNYKIIDTVGQDTAKIVSEISSPVDCVTLMLSLSFFFGSSQDLDALTQTLVQTIKSGGRILFLTINGDAVKELGKTSFTLGGSKFNRPDAKTLDLDMPGTIVEVQREHLVMLSELTVRLGTYGFTLKEHYRATGERVMPVEAAIYSGLYSYGVYEHDGTTPLPSKTTNVEAATSELSNLEIGIGVPVTSPLGQLYMLPQQNASDSLLSAVGLALPSLFNSPPAEWRELVAKELQLPDYQQYQPQEAIAILIGSDPITQALVNYLALAVGHDILVWKKDDNSLSAVGRTEFKFGQVIMVAEDESGVYHAVGILHEGKIHMDISDPATVAVLLSAF